MKHPIDAGLAGQGARTLGREGRKLAVLVGDLKLRVRDRSRALGGALRAISRTLRRRSGAAKSQVLELTAKTGKLLERSIAETGRLAVIARGRARGRGAKAKLRAAARLEQSADRCQRVAGEPIQDRLSDADARPIRQGASPTSLGT